MKRQHWIIIALAVIAALVLGWTLFGRGAGSVPAPATTTAAHRATPGSQKSGSTPGATSTTTKPGAGRTSAGGGSLGTDPASGLAWIAPADLPREAQDTLSLIDKGGPFPYPDHDGVVFSNAEGVLPHEKSGYYHEYTVPTPGASTRGTRRIVTGSAHEFYYTGDHYQTFQRIKR